MFWKRLYPVEKLAVAGAMGLVAALFVFPMFARSRDTGVRRAPCQSNLKLLGLAFAQYEQDHNDQFPPAKADGAAYGWAGLLLPYTKSTQLLQCPSEPHDGQPKPKLTGYTDYWYDSRLFGRAMGDLGLPAQVLMCGDGNDGTETTNARYALSSFPPKWTNDEKSPMFRHEGAANYLFADGHVKGITPPDAVALWSPQGPPTNGNP